MRRSLILIGTPGRRGAPAPRAGEDMKMRNWLPLLCLATLLHPGRAEAQRAEALGPEVRKYLRVSAPRVVLEHVLVIDGTGAAPVPDQNVTIEGGKISAISA